MYCVPSAYIIDVYWNTSICSYPVFLHQCDQIRLRQITWKIKGNKIYILLKTTTPPSFKTVCVELREKDDFRRNINKFMVLGKESQIFSNAKKQDRLEFKTKKVFFFVNRILQSFLFNLYILSKTINVDIFSQGQIFPLLPFINLPWSHLSSHKKIRLTFNLYKQPNKQNTYKQNGLPGGAVCLSDSFASFIVKLSPFFT